MVIDEGPGPEPVKQRSQFELGVDGLIGTTFSLWLKRLPQYLVIVGLTGIGLTLLQVLVLVSFYGFAGIALIEFIGSSPLDSVFSLVIYNFTPDLLILIIILSIASLLVFSIVTGAAIHYTLIDYESSGSGDVRESFSFAFGKALPLIGVQLIESIIILGIVLVGVLVMYFEVIIGIVIILFVFYIAVRLAPSQAVVVAEDKGPMAALSRSWYITGGLFWHVFLGQVLLTLAVFFIDIFLAVGSGIVLAFILQDQAAIILVASLISSFLLSSVNYIFLAVLYKDLEARGTDGKWWE